MSAARPATEPTTPPAIAPIGGFTGGLVVEGLEMLVGFGAEIDGDAAADGVEEVVGIVVLASVVVEWWLVSGVCK